MEDVPGAGRAPVGERPVQGRLHGLACAGLVPAFAAESREAFRVFTVIAAVLGAFFRHTVTGFVRALLWFLVVGHEFLQRLPSQDSDAGCGG